MKQLFGMILFALFPLLSFGQNDTQPRPDDTFVYDVTTDPEAVSANVLQILQKLPFVVVDAVGQITISGLSGTTILVNGIPQLLSALSMADYLKSTPANRVERIEIQTTRKASDQTRGDGGVINIITRQQQRDGESIAVTAHGATSSLLGANATVGVKHKNYFIDGGYAYTGQNDATITSRSTADGNRKKSNIESHTKLQKDNIHNANLHAGIRLTDSDVIGVKYNLFSNVGEADTETTAKVELSGNYTLYSVSQLDVSQSNHNLAAYYQHQFNKGATLSASYEFGSSHSENEVYDVTTIKGSPSSSLYPIDNRTVTYDWMKEKIKEHALRVDAFIPFNPANSLELGTRYSSRKYSALPQSIDRWTAYTQYNLRLTRFRLGVGVNWEIPYDIQSFIDDSFALYPFLKLALQTNKDGWLSFNYTLQRSASEPNLPQGWIGYQWLNKVNLNYQYTNKKWQWIADLSEFNSTDCLLLTQEAFIERPDEFYWNTTEMNYQQTQLSLSARYSPTSTIRLHAQGMLGFKQYSIEDRFEQKTTFGQLSAGGDFILPKEFCLSVNGGYYFPNKTDEVIELANYFYRFNLSKELMQKKMAVAIYATDFFGAKRLTAEEDSHISIPSNEFGISLTYRFMSK